MHAIYSTKRGLFIMSKKKTIFKIKDFVDPSSECTACEACVTVCPTHIDIRKRAWLECINCFGMCWCLYNCNGKLEKPSLVQWSITNTIVEDKPTKGFRKKLQLCILLL